MFHFKTFVFLLPLVSAHSYLGEPVNALRTGIENVNRCQPGTHGRYNPCCGDVSKARPGNLIKSRGDKVDFAWYRNNHGGGFVRMAIVPLKQSGDQKNFDNNVIQFNCAESNCKTGGYEGPFGGDPLGGIPNSNKCTHNFTVPTWLDDGQYTVQWQWYGAVTIIGRNFSLPEDRGQVAYQGCMDFTISNGTKTEPPTKVCPVFAAFNIHAQKEIDKLSTCTVWVPKNQTIAKPLNCYPECPGDLKYDAVPDIVQDCQLSLQSSGPSNTKTVTGTPLPTTSRLVAISTSVVPNFFTSSITVMTSEKPRETAIDVTKPGEEIPQTGAATGGIIGGVAGGVAAAGCAAALVFFLRRKRSVNDFIPDSENASRKAPV